MPSMDDLRPFQGLRAVCAVAIFLGHQTDMFLKSPWGGQGVIVGLEYLQAVSLFFLLSGLPLARLYGAATGKAHTPEGRRDFWRKRVARLAPVYYLALVLNLLVVFATVERYSLSQVLASFFGCALLLQAWFPPLIDVGGVLWQIAVFAYAYAVFPFLSRRLLSWSLSALQWGIVVLWLFSASLFLAVFALYPASAREMGWWYWHVHCLSRLPQVFAGVMLGELVERARQHRLQHGHAAAWARRTDALSVLLLFTALQAPIVQVYYGSAVRSDVSIGLEAFLLPVHAAWLACMVLAHPAEDGESRPSTRCWTREALSYAPLATLGDASLAIYCLHLVVLFIYNMALAWLQTGDCRLMATLDDWQLRVTADWWHAPIQWALVLVVSLAVSRWFERPLRSRLSGAMTPRGGKASAIVAPSGDTSSSVKEEEARLLRQDDPEYGTIPKDTS